MAIIFQRLTVAAALGNKQAEGLRAWAETFRVRGQERAPRQVVMMMEVEGMGCEGVQEQGSGR